MDQKHKSNLIITCLCLIIVFVSLITMYDNFSFHTYNTKTYYDYFLSLNHQGFTLQDYELYKDEYKEEYFEEMNNLLHYRYNVDADCFYLCNCSIDRFSINSVLPIKYLEHKNEEIEAQCIQYVHRVYCKNTYLDMTDFLIETLTGYNEIQIF